MKVFKRSKAYGALEYTLIIALIIVIAILILNFIRNRTHGVTWMDSANDKVSEYIGGSPSGPGGGTPVGSNIELHFENHPLPAFDIKEGETLTKEQIKQYITNNNGKVRNKTTLAEISTYEIEDITYNPFNPSVYIQFKVTSLEGDTVPKIPGNILSGQLADGCVLATDANFDGANNGYFRYNGTAKCVKIPPVIKGVSVTSYNQMFYDTSVEKVISDNSNVTNMMSMFYNSQATSLDLSSLDTSNVTDMRYMFKDSHITSLNLSNFDTSKVTDMSVMFDNSKATSLDLSNFNTSKVTNMSNMFSHSQATSLDLSSFDTSNVTYMGSMFWNSQATSLDLSSFDTSKVIVMSYMFWNSIATSLDLSSFDTSNVTYIDSMFWNSQATTGYAKTTADADKFNATSNKPAGLIFTVK